MGELNRLVQSVEIKRDEQDNACILVYSPIISQMKRGMEKTMDTTRWKSVLVPREVYEEIKELSKSEGRTIGGQLRLVFDWYKDAKTADHGAVIDDNIESR